MVTSLTGAWVLRNCGSSRPPLPGSNPSPGRTTSTQLFFGIPGFFTPQNDDEKSETSTDAAASSEKKISAGGLIQLITAGMGAPFLGDYQGVDEDGKMMFTLEANNLVDEKGNSKQTQMPYFESGWVDPDDKGFKWPWEK